MEPTYSPNVPLARNKFNSSQVDFLNNFMSLYTAFAANHVALDAASNAGNHNVIQLLEQPVGSQFQTDIGEISIYCKSPADADDMNLDQGDQIFLRYQGNQTEFQLSAYQIFAPPKIESGKVIQTPYFTFLPGKVLLYFGTVQCTLSQDGLPLLLRPPIATNIITVNFCPMGTTPNFPPAVNIKTANDNGFYDTIYMLDPISFFPTINTTYFYMVLANI
jgi:hypothetical protein